MMKLAFRMYRSSSSNQSYIKIYNCQKSALSDKTPTLNLDISPCPVTYRIWVVWASSLMFLLFLDVLELELQVTHTFILVGLEPKSSPKIIQSSPETVDFVHFKHRSDSTLDQNVTFGMIMVIRRFRISVCLETWIKKAWIHFTYNIRR